MNDVLSTTPVFTNDAVVFGFLMALLMLVFQTASNPRFKPFYRVMPALLMCYFLPSLLNTLGIISPSWIDLPAALAHLQQLGHDTSAVLNLHDLKQFVLEQQLDEDQFAPFMGESRLYFVASRYLLPASLVLLTLSIDLKQVLGLGPKALIMFFTATVGVVLGGPLAILIVNAFAPGVIHPADGEEVWRGMTTVAGSWIGGGANQAAMYEMWNSPENPISSKMYGIMVTIDIIVAEVWMAFLLLGVGRAASLDKWFKADSSAIDALKDRMQAFTDKVARIPDLRDVMTILGVAFAATGFSHMCADWIAPWISENAPGLERFSLTSGFFWLIVTATTIGLFLSFTRVRNLEGAGASRVGSVFIYILVATIGMRMNILEIFENPGLFLVGLIWMLFHVGLLVVVGKM
ncbi:MAG: putative membrane protein, partial [Gammaproteobacteria bacterium]